MKNKGLIIAIVFVVLLIVVGGIYFNKDSDYTDVNTIIKKDPVTSDSEVVKHKEEDKLLVYKNDEGKEIFKYPSGFKVEEVNTYNVDGTQIVYTGLSVSPPVSVSTLDKDKIFIGAHRISTCEDVPQATRCAGGGKNSFTVTFTNSSDSRIINAFDLIVSTMK